MTMKKRKTLPNTIRLQRAQADVPRSYTNDQVKEIVGHLGPLPAGKIPYPGCFSPFHILGEDHPELAGKFQAYLKDDDQLIISRELALFCCLEAAAWRYKSDKKPTKSDAPSQKLKTLKSFEKACDALIEGMNSFEFMGRGWRLSTLQENVHAALIPLKEEIQYQKKVFSGQKASTRSRHLKDAALHDFVAEMCNIWVHVAGRKLTSGSVSSDGKKVAGPLIWFIQEALKPLEVDKKPNAIRELLRDVRSNQKYRNLI
jgi:hypothetical protein